MFLYTPVRYSKNRIMIAISICTYCRDTERFRPLSLVSFRYSSIISIIFLVYRNLNHLTSIIYFKLINNFELNLGYLVYEFKSLQLFRLESFFNSVKTILDFD